MDNVRLGQELQDLGARLVRAGGIPTAAGQAHMRRQLVAELRRLLVQDGPPDATGVYMRAELAPGLWDAVDIADARLSDAQLLRWLLSQGLNPFGVRLVGVMLGRETLRSYAGE